MTTDSLRPLSPTFHLTLLAVTGAFAGTITLASLLDIEVVAQGQCRVVPLGRIQVVQPEFAGTISAIRTSNGNRVEKGEILIELDTRDAVSERAALLAERRQLTVEDARLQALQDLVSERLDDAPDELVSRIYFPPNSVGSDIAEQQRLFVAEVSEYYASLASVRARMSSNRLAADVIRANIAKMEAAIGIEGERLANAERLLRENVASRSSYLDAEQVYADLKNGREVLLRELDQKLGEQSTLAAERRSIDATVGKTVSSRRTAISARLAALTQQAAVLDRRISAARLVAPVNGTVDRMGVHTLGGVVQAGAELLRVVPTDLGTELECSFANADAGFLREGQRANIRLDAYPAGRFGIKPGARALRVSGRDYPVRPGMTAGADVITGERRIISYFFAPLAETLGSALRER